MNAELAKWLWQFILVYVDNIIIYSRTFEDHLRHLDSILGVMEDVNITLAPKKCHLAYQSLQLLGQKISRLGVSTVKEKVDAAIKSHEGE